MESLNSHTNEDIFIVNLRLMHLIFLTTEIRNNICIMLGCCENRLRAIK